MLKDLLHLVFPPRCILCDEVLDMLHEVVCEPCEINRFLNTGKKCGICSRPLDFNGICDLCSSKREIRIPGYGLLAYEGIIHTCMYRLKYGGRQDVGKALGRMMAKYCPPSLKQVDAIIPIPLHKERLKERGYNQAEVLAYEISKELNIPLNTQDLIRVKNSKPQSQLSPQSRKNNLKDAFILNNAVDYKSILLVDDIYTTGNTMNTCAKILIEAGVEKVYFYTATIAKTV